MLELAQIKTTADIAKELEQDLRVALNPKNNYIMDKSGLWREFPKIVETLLAIGREYETESVMVGTTLVSKSQYLVPKFMEQIVNAQVIWFNGSSTLRTPIIKGGMGTVAEVLPSDVEYFFTSAGLNISSFTSTRYGLMDFAELGVEDSELSIQLGGSVSSIPLAILGIVGKNIDTIHFNTGVKPSKEEIRQWIKTQTKEAK